MDENDQQEPGAAAHPRDEQRLLFQVEDFDPGKNCKQEDKIIELRNKVNSNFD